MDLTHYFSELIRRVEGNDSIGNAGKDKNGFFKPTRAVLLRQLRLLKDLHMKPMAGAMVRDAWSGVVAELPPEWLVLDGPERELLMKILKRGDR